MNERNYFKIESKMPSLNDYQAACRANKYTGAKFKEETEQVVLWSLFEAKRAGTLRKVRPEEYPVELRIEWHEKDKRRDVDNIKSAAKFVLDAMTKSNLITDDSRKFVAQIRDEVIDDKRTYVFVEIIPSRGTR